MSDAALAEETTEKPEVETSKEEPAKAETAEKPAKEETVEKQEKPAKTAAATSKEEVKEEEKPYWPDNWREKMAEHISAGDKKTYDRELKRLQRITDPSGIYGTYRELEAKFSEGNLAKIPGKDATDEDWAAFRKALGVPDKPEGYYEKLELANGATLGEEDKPVANEIFERLHKAGAPPRVANELVNWYFENMEKQAAQLDETDEKSDRETRKAMEEKYGSAKIKQYQNALPALFAEQPGGADIDNPKSLMARLLGGRTADGTLIGNDRDMVEFLWWMNRNINPAATVTEYGASSTKALEEEIAEIRRVMREDRPRYNKDTVMQARYRELLEAQDRNRARSNA